MQLAQQINLPASYDAHDVALAHRLRAELWTTDQRLARTLHPPGFPARALTL